jgi:PhnB protein
MTTPSDSSAPGVQPVPAGYPVLAPYLCIRDAAAAIEFYKKAFGAKERFRMADPSGRVGHAEIEVAGGVVMLADEFPDMGFHSPLHYGGSSIIVHCYVPDVDALADQAVKAGATILRPIADQFYGDRTVALTDPFGHMWNFSTHIEDVSHEEMKRRAKEKFGG